MSWKNVSLESPAALDTLLFRRDVRGVKLLPTVISFRHALPER
jgi:hypothetical protein